MKVLQINVVYGQGSTGLIVKELQEICRAENIDCLCSCGQLNKKNSEFLNAIAISSKWDSRLHGWISKFTMFKGVGSWLKTVLFLKKVRRYGPDLIHLHNLHGSYINLPLLFHYIKKNRIPVIWTLHDCWPMTAICPHFTIVGCERWKNGCGDCPQRGKYSSAPIDMTAQVWLLKKKWFTGMSNALIVTPSAWLEQLVRQSFLKDYHTKTVYNGIDLSVFHPTCSDFKIKYGLGEKKIVLGVAYNWSYEKGLDVFVKLADGLPDNFAIVLVGTNENIEKTLPKRIITIRRTDNQKQLAEIYTAADVFVNPTREEVFGLVNIEALACGTPVITFQTGGSPECIDETCGCLICANDIAEMENSVLRICMGQPYSEKACIARAKIFDQKQRLTEYISLYRELCGKG